MSKLPVEPPAEILGEAIPQLGEPVVFNKLLIDSDGKNLWTLLDWKLTDLAEKLGGLELPFRIGLNAKTSEPQWDFKCEEKSMAMGEFLENVGSLAKTRDWYYFDYKYMHEWFKDHPQILESIDWQRFGFDKQGADSTLWIGTQGAHTNCHQDSYGCNLVAQIQGRKRWILFPPDSAKRLRPTRIPYEESTVYSSFNLFCPSKKEEEYILRIDPKARTLVLVPGQVLLVPSGWWHYVESMDLSISVNVWLPLEKDRESRLGEAVVKLLVNQIGKGLVDTSDQSPVLSHFDTVSLVRMMSYLQVCLNHQNKKTVKTCIDLCNDPEESIPPPEKRRKMIEWSVDKLAKQYPSFVSLIPALQVKELQELLAGNRNRFSDVEYPYSKLAESCSSDLDNETTANFAHKQTTNSLVNALCNPDVIAKVTELLLEARQAE